MAQENNNKEWRLSITAINLLASVNVQEDTRGFVKYKMYICSEEKGRNEQKLSTSV